MYKSKGSPQQLMGVNMEDPGRIYRDGDETVIEIKGMEYLLAQKGVTCVNPEADFKERVYQKRFTKKRVYLPDEYSRAKQDFLSRPDSFIVSMNGYSTFSGEEERRYHASILDYIEACAATLRKTIQRVREEIPGAHIQLIDGASQMGIDLSLFMIEEELNITSESLGFSCPKFMFYVEDDSRPVYVGANKEEYGNRYIESLDLLITTGGRVQALEHDVKASCIYGKRIHFVDILNMLSPGCAPATILLPDGSIKVDNAAAAFGQNISYFDVSGVSLSARRSGDMWNDVFADVSSIAIGVCRRKMSAKRKFR